MKTIYQVDPLQPDLDEKLQTVKENSLSARIWNQDHTVWHPDPAEISNRLAWLSLADQYQTKIPRLETFAEEVHQDDYSQILLLGMGGSSLAPEVFSTIFRGNKSPVLEILDSTHPVEVAHREKEFNPLTTLYIVATKSGTTVETLSLFKYFYQQVEDTLGSKLAGKHFIGITDPGSQLVELAEQAGFREVFLNEPEVGGRYSALSYFGLVPAALIGMDLYKLLGNAQNMTAFSRKKNSSAENPAVYLGCVLAAAAGRGRDKLTLTASESIQSFPNWIEQLLAESTGKDGQGIVPVLEPELDRPGIYSSDRIFVDLSLAAERDRDDRLVALEKAGFPVVRIELDTPYQLGGQFFLWEFATAVAGALMGIHPFNQPNVESAKVRAREMVAEFQSSGSLPSREAHPPDAEMLDEFIHSHKQPGSYLALQAFLPLRPPLEEALISLQRNLQREYQLPVTVGFGPRYLHSTGQLHKGGSDRGLFIQLRDEAQTDLPIPNQLGSSQTSLSFGTLITAQALGDAAALENRGRPVIQFQLGEKPQQWISSLAKK